MDIAIPGTRFIITQARHGQFCVHAGDMIGRLILAYGEWAEREIRFLCDLLRPGDVALDIGAHIGAHAIPFARKVGSTGSVVAFEAQRLVFHNLCTNLHLNGIQNVLAYNAVVSGRPGHVGLRELPYAAWQNSGAFAIPMEAPSHNIPLLTPRLLLDDHLRHLARCRLVKIDVEGHEPAVLDGAAALIGKHRPVVYVEVLTADRFDHVRTILDTLGYTLYWHVEPQFNPENFRGNSTNLLGDKRDLNLVAFPPSWPEVVPELPRATHFSEVQQFAPATGHLEALR